MNLLMLSGDSSVARGQAGAFDAMLGRFSQHWSRIDVICPGGRNAAGRVIHGNVHVHPSPLPKLMQPLFIRRKGGDLLRQRDYALITSHDFGWFYNGLGAWWLHRHGGVPVVSELHHIEGYPRAATRREALYRWLATTWYIPWAKRWVTAFRVVNAVEMPGLLRDLGVPDDNIRVLYSMYIDFDVFHPAETPRRHDVIFVGRFAPNKGLFMLLDAVALVRQTHPQIRVGLRGRGRLEAALRARIAALGLGDTVTLYTDFVTPAELADFYRGAGVLVCASTAEGGPRVAVEALACGTPVISTPVGLMRDLAAESALLTFDWDAAALAEHLRRLLDDPDERDRLAAAGQQAVTRFAAEAVIAAYARGCRQRPPAEAGGLQ